MGVQWVGGAVTAVAARRLDVLALAGVRQPDGQCRPPHPLETSGLYGLVRHPIYFGWILLVLGAPVMTCDARGVCGHQHRLSRRGGAVRRTRPVAMYGDAYRAYQRQVRARLVPGVY